MTATEALAALAASEYGDLPEEVIARAKTSIRDVLGVALYGSRHEVGELVGGYVDRAAPGEAATVLGRGTASPPGAALANGTFAHAVDYDDTFESMVLHPSAPVFPAALAAAESSGASGRDLLTGYVLGVEAAFRVGHSVYPSHYEHGWHHTGTIGCFGAATAAASVLDLPEAETRNAFGIVASGSSSLKKNFGSMTKPLHPGHAAGTGLRAAMLAAAGFTGDDEILDGEMGYGAVMSPDGSYDPTMIEEGGERWGMLDNGFKRQGYSAIMDNLSEYFVLNYHAYEDYIGEGSSGVPGHIPGAFQFTPYQSLSYEQMLGMIPTDMPVIVYCWTGQHSSQIAAYLNMLGYDAYSLTFGSNSLFYDDLTAHKWSAAQTNDFALETTTVAAK